MIVLITGVSSGFGRATAEELSQQGHKVYGTVRREVEPIKGVTYLHADVTESATLQAAVASVVAAEGHIDVLINNAGMGIGGPIEFSTEEDTKAQIDVNFMGTVRATQACLPIMRSQRKGTIICTGSIGGLMGLPFQGLYSASKFAIEGYCEALRLEVKKFGINVVVINPGDFATSFTARRRKTESADAATDYPAYAASMKSIEHDEQSGLKPEYLARRVARILKSRRPRYRYLIASPLQKLSVGLKHILPPRLFATLLSVYYKL
ncbi:MAG: SDR family oxidoreductase [Tidjanibacter sp.]|nr:SDR family oxidoreductase [Tidjanibacter sp.]